MANFNCGVNRVRQMPQQVGIVAVWGDNAQVERTHAHSHARSLIHSLTYSHAQIRTHTHMYTHPHAFTLTHMQAHVVSHTHTHSPPHTHATTHPLTHSRPASSVLLAPPLTSRLPILSLPACPVSPGSSASTSRLHPPTRKQQKTFSKQKTTAFNPTTPNLTFAQDPHS